MFLSPPSRALTAPNCFDLVLSFVLGVLVVAIAALHWADSPWFIFVLHSQLFSPLVLSFQVFFTCSNINLIWEDKEEAWTFLWMYEEVGGCCNTRVRVISSALDWEINHFHLLLELMRFVHNQFKIPIKIPDGNLANWECAHLLNLPVQQWKVSQD